MDPIVTAEIQRIGDQLAAGFLARKRAQDETDLKQIELSARLLDLEQRSVRSRGGSGTADELGPGAGGQALASYVAQDEGFLMVASGRTRDTKIQLPAGAIHGVRAAALTGPGVTGTDRRPDIVVPALRRLTIRDLMLALRTEAGAVEFLRESSFASNAAITAEGELKPETVLTLALQSAPVVTIASWCSASEQILADLPQLSLYLNGRLRQGVRLAEEVQLLNGAGVGNNMLGLTVGGTAYVAPFTIAAGTKLDTLRLAIDQLAIANYDATGIVLHPNDLTEIELLKETTGGYIKSDPNAAGHRTVWGVPVVVTTAQVAGTFTVGDFTQAAVLYDRQDPTLDVGRVADDFIRNMVRLRLEERVSMALLLPGAIVTGSFA